MNTLQLINFGSRELSRKKIDSCILDSELLLSKILNKKREEILINLDQKICANHEQKYNDFIKRRSHKEPVAYICKEKEFWSKNFFVNTDTLIPRPETELMIEQLIKIYKGKKISILDVGTGSGCISISLLSELKNSKAIGIDISKKALKIAKKNLEKHGLQDKIKFLNKSLDSKFYQKVQNSNYVFV